MLHRRHADRPLWTGDEPLAGRTLLLHAEELFRVLLTYRLEPEHLLEEMKALVDEEIEGRGAVCRTGEWILSGECGKPCNPEAAPFRRKGLRKTGFPGYGGFSWMACRYREESCGGVSEESRSGYSGRKMD